MIDDFDDFVVSRGPVLLRFAQLLAGDSHLAEDLVQEVLARSHRRWNRIARMDSPEAYVRKALLREYLSWRRRRSSTETVVQQVGDEPSGDDVERDVASRDEMAQLLATLPRTQRAVLVLRFYDDLPDDQIAALLGWAQPTVRAQASRALARLRTQLAACDSEVSRG